MSMQSQITEGGDLPLAKKSCAAAKPEETTYESDHALDEKKRIINGLLRCIKGTDIALRSEVIDSLLKYSDVATDALVIALLSENKNARAMAAFALGNFRNPRIINILTLASNDECEEVRSWSIKSLGEIGDPKVVPSIIKTLRDQSEVVRAEAACALGKLQDQRAIEPLLLLVFDDPDERVRTWAGQSIIQIQEMIQKGREQEKEPSDIPRIIKNLDMLVFRSTGQNVSSSPPVDIPIQGAKTERMGEMTVPKEKPEIALQGQLDLFSHSLPPVSSDSRIPEGLEVTLPSGGEDLCNGIRWLMADYDTIIIPPVGALGIEISEQKEYPLIISPVSLPSPLPVPGACGEESISMCHLPVLVPEERSNSLPISATAVKNAELVVSQEMDTNPVMPYQNDLDESLRADFSRLVPCYDDEKNAQVTEKESGISPDERCFLDDGTETLLSMDLVEHMISSESDLRIGITSTPPRLPSRYYEVIPSTAEGTEMVLDAALASIPAKKPDERVEQSERGDEPSSLVTANHEKDGEKYLDYHKRWRARALSSERSQVRLLAVITGREIPYTDEMTTLGRLIAERDNDVRETARSLLTRTRDVYSIKTVRDLLSGAQKDPGDERPFYQLLDDGNEDVQVWAAWAAGVERDVRAIPGLARSLHGTSRSVQREAIIALERIGEPAVQSLVQELEYSKGEIRLEIAAVLTRLSPVSVNPLIRLFESSNEDTRILASAILSCIGQPASAALIESLEGWNKTVKGCTVDTLAEIGGAALEPLLASAARGNRRIKSGIIRVLSAFKNPEDINALFGLLSDPSEKTGLIAIEAISTLHDPRVVPHLVRLLDDERETIRLAGIRALGKQKDERAILPLVKKIKDRSGHVRRAAVHTLGELGELMQIPQ